MPQCKGLTNQLFIDVNGFYTPCCFMSSKNTKDLVVSSTPEDWLNSNTMLEIISTMNSGDWANQCNLCKREETEGRNSYRLLYNSEFLKPAGTLESFLINVPNICNLTCRMCSPSYSDKWGKLRKVIPIASNLSTRKKYEKIKHLIGPDFKFLEIAGGEPLLDHELFEVIELILEKCPDLSLQFTTNLTFFPNKYKHILDRVKTIRPIYSIDGVGSLNDYIREGFEWRRVTEVLDQWLGYMSSRPQPSNQQYFQTTVQAYNFHDLHNIKKFIDSKMNINSVNIEWIDFPLGYPKEFVLNALPPEYIEKHTNEVNKKFLVNYNFNEDLFSKLKTRTIDDDKLLGKKIQNYIPELYELFNR